jgi:hypothetical protein
MRRRRRVLEVLLVDVHGGVLLQAACQYWAFGCGGCVGRWMCGCVGMIEKEVREREGDRLKKYTHTHAECR